VSKSQGGSVCPISLPPQCTSTALGKPYKFNPDFDDKLPALFDPDGTYLSFIGNDIFINAIQGALETFFKYPYIHVYPYNEQ
jgi:hypothetical protein